MFVDDVDAWQDAEALAAMVRCDVCGTLTDDDPDGGRVLCSPDCIAAAAGDDVRAAAEFRRAKAIRAIALTHHGFERCALLFQAAHIHDAGRRWMRRSPRADGSES